MRVVTSAWVAFLVAGMVGQDARGDAQVRNLNNTLMHYYQTSAYNPHLDGRRAKDFLQRTDLGLLFGFDESAADAGQSVGYTFYLSARGDKVFANEQDIEGDIDFINCAYGFARENPNGLSYDIHVGQALIGYLPTQQAKVDTRYLNVNAGLELGYSNWFSAGADVGANLVSQGGSGIDVADFDQLTAFVDIPIINAFVDVRYDLGAKQIRDTEGGIYFGLDKWRMGAVSIAWSSRFRYDITGDFFTDDYVNTGKATVIVARDDAAAVHWRRAQPLEALPSLHVGAGFAAGRLPKALVRFAYAEAAYDFLGDSLAAVVRVGHAYGRLQQESRTGYSAGLDLYLGAGFSARAVLGKNDYEVVDRVGATDRLAFSLNILGGFHTERRASLDD